MDKMRIFFIVLNIIFNVIFFAQIFAYSRSALKYCKDSNKNKVILGFCYGMSICAYVFYWLLVCYSSKMNQDFVILLNSNAYLFGVKAILDKKENVSEVC